MHSLTWETAQRNDYLILLVNTFHQLADEPALVVNCDYLREGYRKRPQGGYVVYYKKHKTNQILIVRMLHKSMGVNRAL
ncbi:type II toxin-antitoxin system RelE/ParE family toxin [Psychrosphaera sp. B3R10]|uniref:type II toxin-antitoxin system RelE/ParE family toxin n=1 Tax=Psychrosphaera sp. B3R10 TaxID=2841569 RepID=UPI00352E634B